MILLFSCLLIISGIYFSFIQPNERVATDAVELPLIREISKEVINTSTVPDTFEVLAPKSVRVILARVYLDGEVSEEVVEETILSMEDFWAEYSEWDLVDQDETQVVFQKKIDDISPLLKLNGYFGISEEGTLNIYEGKPSEDRIIQSFFQINTQELKSHQHQELQKGIPVISRDRYEQVLKIYKKLAKQEM